MIVALIIAPAFRISSSKILSGGDNLKLFPVKNVLLLSVNLAELVILHN
jgi:hypothetical protein